MKNFIFLITIVISLSVAGQTVKQTDTLYMDITVQQADTLIQAHVADTNFIIIDVRTPSEYNNGFIEDAININYYAANFSALIDTLNRNKIYLLYCGSGSRSAKARDTMIVKHFVTVYNMLGGMNAWLSAGYPVNMPTVINSSFDASEDIFVYPDPATDYIMTNFKSEPGNNDVILCIYNMDGTLCSMIQNYSPENKINIDHLANGIYHLMLIKEKNIIHEEFIKQ
ncbi:MAG: rhodanese-like domain-containing protein [Bacteroidota bacterium]